MSRLAVAITLSEAERRELAGLARRRKTAQGLARRARIVLAAAADGLENKAIVALVGTDASTVGKWRRRFAECRLDGLYDEPRSGAPRKIGDEEIAEIVSRTLEETPPDGTHWSLRSMGPRGGPCPLDHPPHLAGVRPAAASLGDHQAIGGPAVRRQGARHHRPLSRPARARAGAVRRRKEPDPGARPHATAAAHAARAGRSGAPMTTCATAPPPLFAALDIATGKIIGQCFPASSQPRVPQVPAHARNPAPRRPRRPSGHGQLRHPQDACRQRWLAGHPRWHVHFTPTGASGSTRSSASSRC